VHSSVSEEDQIDSAENLFPDEPLSEEEESNSSDDEDSTSSTVYVDNEEELLDHLLENVLVGAIDLDEIMAASAGKPMGVKPNHLAKIWK